HVRVELSALAAQRAHGARHVLRRTARQAVLAKRRAAVRHRRRGRRQRTVEDSLRSRETTMTVTVTERKPAAERIAVRCVDSDVHPVPKSGVLAQYIPQPWRSKSFLPRKMGDQIYYDAPDYAHAYAMRADTFPADGEFAGSDPDLAFKQLIMEAGADIAILEPAAYPARFPEANHAMTCALNDWHATHWLDGHNNWHERWRGSICVAVEAPEDG